MQTIQQTCPQRNGHRSAGELVIAVDRVTKRYGDTDVLRDITFQVCAGEIFGLLGTNGAGKTTTVEILQGLRRADSGSVNVLGIDPAVDGDLLRRRIGSQLQDAALPDRMRVGEALQLFAALHPTPRPIDELAEEWQLTHLRRRPFAALSGGERQRLFVALALIGRPSLVFLDELTQNLDPSGRRHTWDVIRRVRDGGTTVVLVTHDVEEAERLCDRVAVVHHGRVIAQGTPASLVASFDAWVTVSFTGPDTDPQWFAGLPGVELVYRNGREICIRGASSIVAHVGAQLVQHGQAPGDVRISRPSLEDAFMAMTAQGNG